MNGTHRFALSLLAGGLLLTAGCRQKPDGTAKAYIDQTAVDSAVRPQDDFFTYANGGWIKHTEIPASQPAWGAIFSLSDQALGNMRTILDSLSKVSGLQKGTVAQQVADLYGSIMDSAVIEAKKLDPLKDELGMINAVKDVPGVWAEAGREYKEGNGTLFSFGVGADDKNSRMNVVHFSQGGLGLPNRDYYFNKDTSIQKVRDAYKTYIEKVFSLTGDDQATAAKKAGGVLDAEMALAKVSRTPVQLRDPNANYNRIAVSALPGMTGGLPWNDLLKELGAKTDTVLVGQPEFYKGLNEALKRLPLEEWKSYLTFHLIDNYEPVLGHEFQDAQFAYNHLLSGQSQQQERWKRASSLVDGLLGDALGQLYVQKYFPPEAKQRMLELVNNLQATYAEHIQSLDWMSDSTKKKALVKLNAITKKIGYPDKWKDYSSVTIDRGDAVGNVRQCGQYEYQRGLKKIGQPVDRSEWYMTPPTVDAYYNPTANDINFPAGILQPPFFYKDGDDALNYGAIGLVIGHEMTHGFDDQGRLYDADGNLKDWWSPEDAARFKQKANLVVQQYNGFIAVDTFHINGNLTLGENIADVGGLSLAYGAFKKTAQGKDTTLIDGLTPDQRFFRSFAQVWKVKSRPEVLRTQVMTNPHSTPQFRVNGPVSNLNAYYTTYNVQPSDKMYRPDSLRAHIW
ncbi:M13 family metallopeptidase [Dinghuibacter silviterrae]|uniref:Putative endopeptidase n=1 Tax=Dinghuibacter silviterrae TaxID=1539049 RepID=A0A4R8DGK8_9BACT|nr:M13 family metallopeptidase [Dinghuibacter silviterrae]TDW96793.1 putative endopeptidase [Dinghuibacter silviterrae]